jgi:hypothetical protein
VHGPASTAPGKLEEPPVQGGCDPMAEQRRIDADEVDVGGPRVRLGPEPAKCWENSAGNNSARCSDPASPPNPPQDRKSVV